MRDILISEVKVGRIVVRHLEHKDHKTFLAITSTWFTLTVWKVKRAHNQSGSFSTCCRPGWLRVGISFPHILKNTCLLNVMSYRSGFACRVECMKFVRQICIYQWDSFFHTGMSPGAGCVVWDCEVWPELINHWGYYYVYNLQWVQL